MNKKARSLPWGGALFALLVGAAANAQIADTSNDNPLSDSNGVDLVSGDINLPDSANAVQIGPLNYTHFISKSITTLSAGIFYTSLTDNGQSININNDGAFIVGSEMLYYVWSSADSRFYNDNGDGSYVVKTGAHKYEVHAADGSIIYFDGVNPSSVSELPKITRIVSPNGYQQTVVYRLKGSTSYGVTSYFYLGVNAIYDNLGYALRFDYESDDPNSAGYTKIKKISGYNLAYDDCNLTTGNCADISGRPKLLVSSSSTSVSLTNAAGGVTTITTSGTAANNSLQTVAVRFPNGVAGSYDSKVLKFSSGGVYSIEDGQGVTTYQQGTGSNSSSILRTITAPDSTVSRADVKYVYSGRKNRVNYVDDALSRRTSYTYDTKGRLIGRVFPEGNSETLVRDAFGRVNEKKVVGKTGLSAGYLSTRWSYPSNCANLVLCNRPIQVTDPNGNVTDFAYDVTHGGVILQTLPPDAGGLRAQVRTEYVQRYARIKTAGGGYTHAASPIWLKVREKSCRNSATLVNYLCSAGANDEVVTEYDYGPDSGPNNLLLRGIAVTSGGQTLRTCFAYDENGRKVSETRPSANLASCS